MEGHTDSVGTYAYNQKLSERRAAAVRDVLVNQYGVADARVSSVGYGESRPVADNATDAGRAVNRRVEAEVEAQVQQ
ncbi:Outer membrane porin F precursor [compost metagenome]